MQQGKKLYDTVVCAARMPSAVLPKLHRIAFGGCRPMYIQTLYANILTVWCYAVQLIRVLIDKRMPVFQNDTMD